MASLRGRFAAASFGLRVPGFWICAAMRVSRALPSKAAGRIAMTAFNVVRFRVKPGRDQEFLDAHRRVERNWAGLRHANMIKTGEGLYCIVAEWDDMDSLAAARPNMIATLDSFRDTLEELGGDLGVTDPASGPVVLELKLRRNRRVRDAAGSTRHSGRRRIRLGPVAAP